MQNLTSESDIEVSFEDAGFQSECEKYLYAGPRKHISSLRHFLHDLSAALKGIFPNTKSTYNRVHVMLISWGPNDVLGTSLEVKDLQATFRDLYNFSTETYTIPSERSQRALMTKLNAINQEHADFYDLLIVYYKVMGSTGKVEISGTPGEYGQKQHPVKYRLN